MPGSRSDWRPLLLALAREVARAGRGRRMLAKVPRSLGPGKRAATWRRSGPDAGANFADVRVAARFVPPDVGPFLGERRERRCARCTKPAGACSALRKAVRPAADGTSAQHVLGDLQIVLEPSQRRHTALAQRIVVGADRVPGAISPSTTRLIRATRARGSSARLILRRTARAARRRAARPRAARRCRAWCRRCRRGCRR